MQRNRYHPLFLLLLVMLMLFSITSTTTYAKSFVLDPEHQGSISVALLDKSTNRKLSGGSLELSRVIDISQVSEYYLDYTLAKDYKESKLNIENLADEKLAEAFEAYKFKNNLPGTVKTITKDPVLFDDLTPGIYLITQPERTPGYYKIAPFLVSIPMTTEDGTEWTYDVDANPKVEAIPYVPDFESTSLTVYKVWNGGDNNRPDNISVSLLRDGQAVGTTVLNEQNGWMYTWYHLDPQFRWNATESEVPDQYTVSYTQTGTTIKIENSYIPVINPPTRELTVYKEWKGTETVGHTDEVTIQLWNRDVLYNTVTLSDSNAWSHTWTNLPKDGDFRVREINVPEHYKVSYSVEANVITITNRLLSKPTPTVQPTPTPPAKPTPSTEPTLPVKPTPPTEPTLPVKPTPPTKPTGPTLVQTGQLNWPIPIFTISGLLLFAIGWVLVFQKRKRHDS